MMCKKKKKTIFPKIVTYVHFTHELDESFESLPNTQKGNHFIKQTNKQNVKNQIPIINNYSYSALNNSYIYTNAI